MIAAAFVQFHDGVYLVLLMGLLEGYFVPLYHFHLTPTTNDQKVVLLPQLNSLLYINQHILKRVKFYLKSIELCLSLSCTQAHML